jgi:hypothetical protein
MEKVENKKENKLIKIESLSPSKFLNIDLIKQNQQKLAAANPVIKIIDNASYKKSDTSRKALKKGRTTIQNSKKIDLEVLKNSLLTPLSNTYDEFVEITKPIEDEHETNCKVWEAKVKEEERIAAEKEALRKSNIQTKISDFQDTWSEKLTKLTYGEITAVEKEFEVLTNDLNLEEEYQEFQMEFSVKHQAIDERLKSSIKLLTENEEVRIENEKLTNYNDRLEILLSIGSKLSETGITLENIATETPSTFVSKESLKEMTNEAWEKCLLKFNKINIANEAKLLTDRSKKRVEEITKLAFILNKENESYDFELKDESKIECFFTVVKTASVELWNDLIKDWSNVIEEDKKPTPEPIAEIAVVDPIIEAVPVVKIPEVNTIPTSVPKKVPITFSGPTMVIGEDKLEKKLIGWDLVIFNFLKETEEPTVQGFTTFLINNYNPPTQK